MNAFWRWKELIPPILCRLFARTEGRHPRLLTDQEIADRSGLSVEAVAAVQALTSWDCVQVGVMQKFLKGCRLDFANPGQMRRTVQYIRKRLTRRFDYARKDPAWETKFLALYMSWRESAEKSRSSESPTPRR